ncbi:MAG: sialate O-acetylesterase [Armatimonadota bacterium]|nr:sialate O-acetylesterase [Armatimonadota bacterium]
MKVYSTPAVWKFLVCVLAASGAAFAEEPSNKTHTWDNNPKGVQVFILAGQSNMVGHGKADEGHDNVKGQSAACVTRSNTIPKTTVTWSTRTAPGKPATTSRSGGAIAISPPRAPSSRAI